MEHLAFRKILPACPKCHSKMTMQGYCRGRDPRWDSQEMSWHLHGQQLIAGCDTDGEHLHLKCERCNYSATMETADSGRKAVDGLIDSMRT